MPFNVVIYALSPNREDILEAKMVPDLYEATNGGRITQ